jgi:RimJ/RimL family protein N-acetyltransferase
VRTARLSLRRFARDDLDELAAMVADPDQMRFYPRPKTRDEAAAWIERNLGLYESHGYGTWRLELRATGEFAGYCGIRPVVLEGTPEVELAWHVKKTLWNRGVASEAAAASRDAAFADFGLARLAAVIHPDNVASRRVAEKIGMHVERQTVLEDDYPALIYVAEA